MPLTYPEADAMWRADNPFPVAHMVDDVRVESTPAEYEALAAEGAHILVVESRQHEENQTTKTLGEQIHKHIANMDAARAKLAVDEADRIAVNAMPPWDQATNAQRPEILRVSLDEGLLSLSALIEYLVRAGVIDITEEEV